MLIIGLTGPKGSGKDTVADLLVSYYQAQWKTVRRLAFADPIKKTIQHIFGLDDKTNEQYDRMKRSSIDIFDGDKIMRTVQGRHVVREIGMLMRNYDEKQFNDYVEEQFASARFTSNNVFIVTDLRFDNEYTLLRRWGNAKAQEKLLAALNPQVKKACSILTLAEKLHFHLLKLARPEHELTGRNFVTEGFADLGNAKRQPFARGIQHMLKIHVNPLAGFAAQVDRFFAQVTRKIPQVRFH